MSAIDQKLIQTLNAAPIPQVSTLPEFVKVTTHNMRGRFMETATMLEDRAKQLSKAADDCLERAKRIRDAAPSLADEIEGIYNYEIDSRDKALSLALVK